jgi:hypothetical protein
MLLLSLTMAACSSAKFNSNSDRRLSPKQQNCAFKISNTVPKEGYEEIGIVDISHPENIRSVEDFKNLVREQVCSAGGDLVVGEINGMGWYVRGTVFSKK